MATSKMEEIRRKIEESGGVGFLSEREKQAIVNEWCREVLRINQEVQGKRIRARVKELEKAGGA